MGKHTRPVGISARGPLKRLSPAGLILAMPGAMGVFRHVPAEHIFGEHVRCPCGESHTLRPVGEVWREACRRWFIQTERTVLCYREPDGMLEHVDGPCTPTVRRVDGEWIEVPA